MGLTVAEQNKALNALTGRANYTASAAVYAKLHTGAPGDAGTANASTDTLRKLVAWAAPSSGAIASSAAVSWTLALSGTETLTHASYWDALTGGNCIGWSALSASATMGNGEVFTLSSGGLTMTLTGTKWTDAVKNAILNAWAGLATYTASAGFFLKLYTGDPGTAGSSNAATETLRKSVTFGTAAASGSIANTAAIAWTGMAGPTAPTTETVSWGGWYDALTSGNFLGRDDLATARAISSGDGMDVDIGGLTLSFS
jgi:hypothetical protein